MNMKLTQSKLSKLLFSTFLAGSTLLGVNSPAMAAPPAAKDTLKIGISSEFETLNPVIAEQAATMYMLYLAWRPLVALSLENKWAPILLSEFPTVENKLVKKKGEGLEVTMNIKPEAQWGDGKPVTCKDIEFAWRVGKHANTPLASKEAYTNISSITWDQATPKKCVVNFIKAKFNYFANFIDPMPEHLEGPVFEKFKDKPEGYSHNTLYTKTPTNPGLYNGPYVISEVKLGSHVIFTANPKFGGKQPAIKKIILKLIPNTNTMTTSLQAGDIDLVGAASGLSMDQAMAFEKRVAAEKLPFKVMFVEGFVYSHIDLNLDNPMLAELPVRKAMALAMNRKQLVDSFFEKKAKEATQFVSDANPWYNSKVPKYDYSRREANKVLDEAGWKMGPNGVRTKNGKTLSFTIIGSSGLKLIENIEAFLQAQFKGVGIELKIKNEPGRVFFGETLKHRKFDLAFYSWVSLPESSPRSMLSSKEIPSPENAWNGQNNPGYKNPEVDKLIDALELEFDAQKRTEIARQIIDHYVKDIPVLPVYFRPANAVSVIGLKGYNPSGHLGYETLWAEDWSLQ